MRILSLILAFAIAASTFGAGAGMSAAAVAAADGTDDHSCCMSRDPAQSSDDQRDTPHEDCNGACLMVCCRTVTTPADPVATQLDISPLAVRIVLPPLHANDLREPQSIFHPPRA